MACILRSICSRSSAVAFESLNVHLPLKRDRGQRVRACGDLQCNALSFLRARLSLTHHDRLEIGERFAEEVAENPAVNEAAILMLIAFAELVGAPVDERWRHTQDGEEQVGDSQRKKVVICDTSH